MTATQIITVLERTHSIFRNPSYLNNFKGSKSGSSDCNKYVPLFSLTVHELITLETDPVISIIEYTTPTINPVTRVNSISQYSQLLDCLKGSLGVNAFKFLVAGEPEYIYVHRGILMNEQGEILLCLGLESEYVMNINLDIIRLNPDVNKTMIFISNDFCNNPKYKNLKKKLGEIYVGPAIELGIDVLQTEKIDKWLFNNNMMNLKFKTVMQQQKFLKEEVPQEMIEVL